MPAISTPTAIPIWETSTSPPALARAQLHLWHVDLADLACDSRLLGEPEMARMQGFSDSHTSRQFCAMRSLLKRLIGGYCDCPASTVILGIQDGGKPCLDTPTSDLDFNISHSHGVGLLAFARGMAVGVDIERHRPLANWQRIAQRSFAPDTAAGLPRQDAPPDAFFQRWTELEARQKCLGRGLFSARVSDAATGLHSFSPAAGQFASLAWANPGSVPELRYLRWPPGADD